MLASSHEGQPVICLPVAVGAFMVWNAMVLKRKASEDVAVFSPNMLSHGHSVTGLLMCAQCIFLERGESAIFTI